MPAVLVWSIIIYLTHCGEKTSLSGYKIMAGNGNLQFKTDCALQWDSGILCISDLSFNTCEGFDQYT
jgi:hypothetical protein